MVIKCKLLLCFLCFKSFVNLKFYEIKSVINIGEIEESYVSLCYLLCGFCVVEMNNVIGEYFMVRDKNENMVGEKVLNGKDV